MATTTRLVFQPLEEPSLTITPPVISSLWVPGKSACDFDKSVKSVIYPMLFNKQQIFFLSSEVFRLNLEQGRFLNSLQTEAV